ncbi:MAG: hypothetical protein WBG37_06100 [Desulfobacterales bacterium]
MNNRILVSRLNRTQAAVWHLGRGETPELPVEPGYTDVSEASAFLVLFGPNVFSIAEKLTPLDFMQPDRQAPFLLQGPFSHVGCKIIVLAKKKNGSGAILLTCARGYAEAMVHAILAAGAAYGLRPAGESRFTSWLASLQD